MTAEQLKQFIFEDPNWDAPFFKKLAHNDTGRARGHQGGVVIPLELRPFFPALDEDLTTATAPTTDRYLMAEMFVVGQFVAHNRVRYQIQTWGGTRSPESRITDNLGPIRNRAQGGDILIMQRSRDRLESFRLVLLRRTDPQFGEFAAFLGTRRWGPLTGTHIPITQPELVAARVAMLAEANQPFAAVLGEVRRRTVTREAIARDAAFRDTLLGQYQRRCSVSGIALATLSAAEVQAAHVIPLERGGPDEPRNGIVLTGTLHWAFDRGLFGVSPQRRIVVPPTVQAMPANAWLRQYHGHAVTEALIPRLRTAEEAFEWHRQNMLAQWM